MNTIPPHVEIGGTIRSLTTDGLHQLMKRVKEVLNILLKNQILIYYRLLSIFWAHCVNGAFNNIYMRVVRDILYCDAIEDIMGVKVYLFIFFFHY